MDNAAKQPKVSSRESVYGFLVHYIKENGFAPSVKEISIGTGLRSTCTVHNHLLKLEDEGRIEMKRNSPRAIKLAGYEYRKA